MRHAVWGASPCGACGLRAKRCGGGASCRGNSRRPWRRISCGSSNTCSNNPVDAAPAPVPAATVQELQATAWGPAPVSAATGPGIQALANLAAGSEFKSLRPQGPAGPTQARRAQGTHCANGDEVRCGCPRRTMAGVCAKHMCSPHRRLTATEHGREVSTQSCLVGGRGLTLKGAPEPEGLQPWPLTLRIRCGRLSGRPFERP